MKVKVYAKLNLTLDVYAKQGAFHPIDSVVTSVDICDIVEVAVRTDGRINVCGVQGVEMERNTAYKAAVGFRRMFGHLVSKKINGVDIFVQKGIPFGGGLGGSSADAAAVVYCMCRLYGVDIYSGEVHELCASLGSDVNFMLFGGLARMQGKGDDVTLYKLNQPLYFAVTTFEQGMNTAEVYAAFDNINLKREHNATRKSDNRGKLADETLALLQQGANSEAIKLFTNDLQQATISLNNYAGDYLHYISSNGLQCCLTGSGSAYYVACATKAQAEQVAEKLNARGFATRVCISVPYGIVEI
ncbi:MAG: 4-(cytidine 5'-diphospho)-2-C-methyl-D-erythritol kinase [Clostridiales bacterium]|nr:4-(cytidine 5'-diphospho)-2-C-methyl-D-erythritol kinase [Clostridiales bacterium]